MSTVAVRPATPGDAAIVAELLGQLGYPAPVAAIPARLERVRAKGDAEALVATLGDVVVGLATVHARDVLHHGVPVVQLTALVVPPAQRGIGIGRALVDVVLAWAGARGADRLVVTTALHRADAPLNFDPETGMRSSSSFLVVAALFAVCHAKPVAAQGTEPPLSTGVRILPATTLSAIADSMPGAVTSRQLARFEGLSGMIARRDSAGIPERHERFTDVFFVERGAARLRYGGSTDDARQISAGEWRGGTIRGGTDADLHTGDVVVIPAGIPHQMLLAPGQRIDYVALKVPKDSTP